MESPKNSAPTQKGLIIFTHIPKTAGTSLRHILMQQYGQDAVFMFYEAPALTGGAKNGNELLNELRSYFPEFPESNQQNFNRLMELKALSGHISFGIHNLFPVTNFHYITLLREPIARAISFYYHMQKSSEKEHETAQKLSIEELICSKASIEFDNLQVRMISGVGWTVPYGHCSYSMLEKAKHNLLHYYTFGIQDRFAETLEKFRKNLGWSEIQMVTQNVGKNKNNISDIGQPTLNLIAEHNLLDIELYQFAKQLFEEQQKLQALKIFKESSHHKYPKQDIQQGKISQVHEEQVLDILEVFKFTATSREVVVNFSIDLPKSNTKVDPSSMIIGGWVVGKQSRVTAVELIYEDQVIQKAPVNGSRPDVAKVFAEVPNAENSGFTAEVKLIGMPSEAELLIQAIFDDESCVPLGVVRFLQKPLNPRYESALSETKKELQHLQSQVHQELAVDVERLQFQIDKIETEMKA